MSINRDLRGLAGQPPSDQLAAGSVPDRGAKRGAVGETVKVMLREVSERHGEDPLANEFVDEIANALRVTWVEEVLCDRVDQPEAMLGVAKQDDPRVAGEPLISRFDFEGAVEIGREPVTLNPGLARPSRCLKDFFYSLIAGDPTPIFSLLPNFVNSSG